MSRVALALVLCGCAPAPPSEPTSLIAFARDFSGYRQWRSFFVAGGIAQASSHLAGDRTIFLNRAPPHGATQFPVGTVLVKAVASSTQTFAMVKRGGDYNVDGALNWEWFELEDQGPDTVVILWRGLGPPAGEGYGGPSNTGCNNCHSGAWDNDFVQAAALNLANF